MTTSSPKVVTRSDLVRDLRAAGLGPGDSICVHTRLSGLGLVIGGARSLIEALMDVVGQEGGIMMPTFSGDLSDPAEWNHPPVPTRDYDRIRRETPPFDPDLTPSRGMGAVPELFRHYPGVRRSRHPQSSFAAWGGRAGQLVDDHGLDFRFGPNSPLARLVELDGYSVLIGAPLETNSLLYLSQYRVGWLIPVHKKAPVAPGRPNAFNRWISYRDTLYPKSWFAPVTEHLLAAGIARAVRIGEARSLIFPARATVDATAQWRRRHGQ